MGNCCKVVKKENQKPIGENVTITTEDRSQRQKTLTISCKALNLSLTVRFRPTIPLSDLKEQIVSSYPELNIDKISLFRDENEILDPTATLQQLGIAPGDCLTLVIREDVSESQDIIASESHSFAQPNEEIKTVDINSVNAKKGMASRNIAESGLTSPKKPAKELWRTALPSPPSRPLINCDPLDASSFTNNTQDKSLKANQPAFQMKLPQPGLESDESGIENPNLVLDAENNSDFQDLKGPFYMFQKG